MLYNLTPNYMYLSDLVPLLVQDNIPRGAEGVREIENVLYYIIVKL